MKKKTDELKKTADRKVVPFPAIPGELDRDVRVSDLERAGDSPKLRALIREIRRCWPEDDCRCGTLYASSSQPGIGVTITIITKEGEEDKRRIEAEDYEEFATRVYNISREHGFQEWVTPRHFAHLVNHTLKPETPVTYNGIWPHEHKVHLAKNLRLEFWWDADEECRLKAHLVRGMQAVEGASFRSPEDAIGWLSVVKEIVDRSF